MDIYTCITDVYHIVITRRAHGCDRYRPPSSVAPFIYLSCNPRLVKHNGLLFPLVLMMGLISIHERWGLDPWKISSKT